MQLDAFALSIAGRRSNNEYAVCARPDLGLFVVADGMGGYEGGEIASALAVEAIHELVRRTASDADVTWPYKIDPALTPSENELMIATRLANARIAERRVGELWYRKGQDKFYLSIAFGFAEVLPDRVTILARLAERAEDIDVSRAEAAKTRAQERLSQLKSDVDYERARVALMKSLIRLQVSARTPGGARVAELKRMRETTRG